MLPLEFACSAAAASKVSLQAQPCPVESLTDADAPSDAGHTWGEPRADDAGDDAGRDAGAARPEPGAAAVQMAVKILCEATEDRVMDTLEEVRLKARARLAALFAQSVAEGHQAYDPDPVVSGPGAFYDSALIAANLFPEDVVDEALAQVVDSSDSISDTPPEGRPAEEPTPVVAGSLPAPTNTTCSLATAVEEGYRQGKEPSAAPPERRPSATASGRGAASGGRQGPGPHSAQGAGDSPGRVPGRDRDRDLQQRPGPGRT